MDQSNYIMNLTENALRAENISSKKCFLCGKEPSTGAGEHVIPKWLQRRYNLSNNQITLLNNTLFPYRALTIPACENCNNSVLKGTEDFVSSLTPDDIANWTLKHRFEVGRWMAKIFLGILIKESALSLDQRKQERGNIVPVDYLDELHFIHLLVQSWRKSITFNCLHAGHPFTLYVYEIIEDGQYGCFDISTNLYGKSICIRFGGLGFAFIADGGLQHQSGKLGPYELAFRKLHPIQFSEISARIHYKACLRDATHTYVHHEDSKSFTINQSSVSPYTNTLLPNGETQIFKPWNDSDLTEFLDIYGVPNFEHLVDQDGAARFTRLVGEADNFIRMSSKAHFDKQCD